MRRKNAFLTWYSQKVWSSWSAKVCSNSEETEHTLAFTRVWFISHPYSGEKNMRCGLCRKIWLQRICKLPALSLIRCTFSACLTYEANLRRTHQLLRETSLVCKYWRWTIKSSNRQFERPFFYLWLPNLCRQKIQQTVKVICQNFIKPPSIYSCCTMKGGSESTFGILISNNCLCAPTLVATG